MNDKQIDELINKVLQEDQTLPEGLSERLEQQIDSWAASEKKKTVRSSFHRRSLYWLSGAVAAILLLCIGIFGLTDLNTGRQLADTYTNPQEAAIAAREALAFMSVNLNKGIDQMNDAQQEINKVNKILNKHLKD